MNATDLNTERFVQPQWLPFKIASNQRELHSSITNYGAVSTSESELAFAVALNAFKTIPNPFLAGDLLGAALNLGRVSEAKELAEYISNHGFVGPTLMKMALEILGRAPQLSPSDHDIRSRVRDSRKWLHRFPSDAIAQIENARLYTVIGQRKPARRAIDRALLFAPNDRHVVRAAIRFYIHVGELDRAYTVAGSAAKATNDPWITSLWVSMGSQLGKVPYGFKSMFAGAMLSRDRFHFSELLEACASQEIMAGTDKKARRGFKQAWIDPAKTVITHSQWVLREKMPGLAGTVAIDFSKSSEAMAWVALGGFELDRAAQSSIEWALEEPFSPKPYMHGSYIYTLKEQFRSAEELAREGLQANPEHDGLVNNLAFSLLRQGKLMEAECLLKQMKVNFEQTSNFALAATWGLLKMKQKAHADGRHYYKIAMEQARGLSDKRPSLRLLLNYLIAEIDTGGSVNVELLAFLPDSIATVSDVGVLVTADSLRVRLMDALSLFIDEKEQTIIARFDKAVQRRVSEVRKLVTR
jgi:tetratricopeptide (TPR) repeat protein